MKSYVHGGDIYSAMEHHARVIDFSANINPLGMPKSVEIAAKSAVEECGNYPDPFCRELVKELSLQTGVNPDSIIAGNGAADLIFRLVLAILPRRALVLAPTFSEYEKALRAVGCQIEYSYLEKANSFTLTEDYLNELSSDIDIIFICNPNNPTGVLTERELLLKILDKAREKNIFMVLDECFNDFIELPENYTLRNYVDKYNNLFILDAFTKMYAMAGLRLGYALCSNRELLDKMYEVAQAWSVSTPAQKAGIAALKETQHAENTRKLIKIEREYLTNGLLNLGFEVIPSSANYIFFSYKGEKNLKDELFKKAILIRSCNNYKGLDNSYYRIAVKGHEDNEALLKALNSI